LFLWTASLTYFWAGTTERGKASNALPKNESKEAIFNLRKQFFSSSLTVSYANSGPLMIVKVRNP
jgi:hypothetical protein